jgi:hypothetical protein
MTTMSKPKTLDDVCAICLDPMTSDYFTERCDHSFHIRCSNRWKLKNPIRSKCPLCMKIMSGYIVTNKHYLIEDILRVVPQFDPNSKLALYALSKIPLTPELANFIVSLEDEIDSWLKFLNYTKRSYSRIWFFHIKDKKDARSLYKQAIYLYEYHRCRIYEIFFKYVDDILKRTPRSGESLRPSRYTNLRY